MSDFSFTFSYFYDVWTRILFPATMDTLYMTLWAGLLSIIFGMIFGVIIYITDSGSLVPMKRLNSVLNVIVNVGRSIPFIILIIAVIPITSFIVDTTIGKEAAVVPLSIAATPFVARIIDNALKELDKGVIEAAQSFGASNTQIIFRVLLPESSQAIINALTLTVINIIGYTAMAGVIGAGGLGYVAINYGYTKYRYDILYLTLIIIIVIVQLVQFVGNRLANRFDKS